MLTRVAPFKVGSASPPAAPARPEAARSNPLSWALAGETPAVHIVIDASTTTPEALLIAGFGDHLGMQR